MSIEQNLDRIAVALETLAAYTQRLSLPVVVGPLGAGPTAATTTIALPDLPGEPIPGVPQPKKGPGRPPKAAAPTPTAVAPVASTPVEADPFAEDGAAAPAVEEKLLTEGDVRLELQALATRLGSTKKVFEIMRAIANAETLPKVKPEFYKRIIAAAKAS